LASPARPADELLPGPNGIIEPDLPVADGSRLLNPGGGKHTYRLVAFNSQHAITDNRSVVSDGCIG
jgi:hypothetical protein